MDILRIHSLHASHVGPFNEIHLQFPAKAKEGLAEMHIFSGENGTGKSTLLEMLSSFGNLTPNLISKFHTEYQGPNTISVEIIYKKENEPAVIEISSNEVFGQARRKTQSSAAIAEYFNNLNLIQPSRSDYSYAFFAYSGYRRLNAVQLGAIQELNTNPLSHALDFKQSINPQLLIQWIANTKTKEALSLAKGNTQKANQYHNAVAKIEGVIREITDLSVRFELEDNPLAVSVKTENIKLQFDTLPDGLKSIISWISDLLMRMDRLSWKDNIDIFDRNFILFLDEIEVHLHPKWQRKILPVIQKLFKNAQIFISTHSPFVLGSIDNAWVYKFEKEGMYSKLAMEPFLSEDAKSYRMILEEIFDINKQFGVGVEKQLDRFYQLKNEILRSDHTHINEFNDLARSLASQSNELENIIGMEIKQIKKLKGEQFEIRL